MWNQKSPEEKEQAVVEANFVQGGKLSLLIVEAMLYIETDLWGIMDPFVVVEYLEVKYKTATAKDGGRKPKWGETLEIPVQSLYHSLKMSCMDEDYITNDQIGSGTMTVKSLINHLNPQATRESWVKLTHKKQVSVEILVRASITPYVKAAGVINKSGSNKNLGF